MPYKDLEIAKIKSAERTKAYRKKHPEKSRASARKYRAENLEKCRANAREYHKNNREKESATQRRTRADRIDKFDLLKMERPCYDCGGTFPPESMDWDHKPGTIKSFDVALGVTSYSFDRVVDEIAKCQLVCACCHRVRTKSRMQEKKGDE